MISCKAIASSAGAAAYHLEKNGQQQASDGRAEYYQNNQVRSAWGGAGAGIFKGDNGAIVGQGSPVGKADFVKVLEGHVTDADGTERQLGKWDRDEAGEKVWRHRAGWDFTFSAPKSVSIASEVFGQADVRAAHENAVAAGMRFLQAKAAQTRIDGKTVATRNLLFARFEHSISRELDPQTHTHVIIANATYHAGSGRWYSLSNEKLLEWRATADQIYKNEMAAHLQAAGHRLEFDGKGGFEFAGYSKDQLAEFSIRSQQIDEALRARGIDPATASYQARQAACLDTRQGKDAPENAEAQRAHWLERAREAGIEAPRPNINEARLATGRSANEALAKALNHITERESAFSERDLYKHTAIFSHGTADLEQIEKAIKQAADRGELIYREDGKLTTREAVAAEQWAARHLEAGRGVHQTVMTEKEFREALVRFEIAKSFELTPEQREAARAILTGNDRFQGVQGLAGTGKTTMLQFVREAAESKGWQVIGHSNGAEQAAKLQQESGIQSTTTARHLIEEARIQRDAGLAKAALDTWERQQSSPFYTKPDFQKLEKDVELGAVAKEYDAGGRAFLIDREGNTWTPGLYLDRASTTSGNLNHAGLTDTRYVVTDGGVFKQGGTLVSEAAGAARNALREATDGNKAVDWAAGKTLGQFEAWQKAGPLESLTARAQIALETRQAIAAEREALQRQAAPVNGGKVLRVADEASLSGQREFNRVIQTTEEAGARTVFLGDKLQHQAVEAGRAFEKAQGHMQTSHLGRESIRRQTTDLAKQTVGRILDGKHDEAMKGLPTVEVRDTQEKAIAAGGDRAAIREASKTDNQAVIQRLAKDYAGLTPEQRKGTLVITATNADRQAINSAVRENLKAQGELGPGRTTVVLERSDRTSAQLREATSYQKGDTVQFQRDYKSLGVEKGQTGEVARTDARLGTVTVKLDTGRDVTVQPSRHQVQAYRSVEKEFGTGDRVRFTQNCRELGGLNVRNGQQATVEKFDGRNMTVKLDNGDRRAVDLDQYKHVDHAYVSTSHSSQGQTVDRVMIHHNTESGRHGDRETYVNVTRAREGAVVYTQDADRAAAQAGIQLNNEVAIETARAGGLAAEAGRQTAGAARVETICKASEPTRGAQKGADRPSAGSTRERSATGRESRDSTARTEPGRGGQSAARTSTGSGAGSSR